MRLLDKLRSKTPAEEPYNCFFRQEFVQSSNFRGYKRYYVSYYGYKEAEEGLKNFLSSGSDLKGASILIRGVDRNGDRFLDISVNDYLIGSVPFWNLSEEQKKDIDLLFAGKCDGAHIRMEEGKVIGNGSIEEREKIYLFLHYGS